MRKIVILLLALVLVVGMIVPASAMSPSMSFKNDEGTYVGSGVTDEYRCRTGASFSNATCEMNYSRSIVLACSLDMQIAYSSHYYHKDVDDSYQGKALTVTGSNALKLYVNGELKTQYGSIESVSATYNFGQYFSKHHTIT